MVAARTELRKGIKSGYSSRLLDEVHSSENPETGPADGEDLSDADGSGPIPSIRTRGMVPVTGPTGSGKSTTLYAAINELNEVSRNTITVEDPIEYRVDGIKQTQVNAKAGYTFASGLRAALRADPDIILVGEIRDLETASIATEAALTGRLVLSTLHPPRVRPA